MSTFLELVQELHRESGAAGTQPSSVASQTGEALRLVNWVKQANIEVQSLYTNWKFLRETFTQNLTAGDNTLDPPSDFDAGTWDFDTFRITPAGETESEIILGAEYEDVKTEDVDTTSGTPWRVVVMPDDSLRFEGTPDAADTFSADYYRAPDLTELNGNTDTSSIPARFHRIITGWALILYANFEGAEEMRIQGEDIVYGRKMPNGHREGGLLARLENSQLPSKRNARFRTGADIVVQSE